MSDTRARARAQAITAHAGQTYGDAPYEVHLDHVAAVVERFIDAADARRGDLVVAAYLHDIVEDTAVTIDAVEADFGAAVAGLVAAVTDSPGRDRKERKAKTYPRIRATGPAAVLLKLADRIANVEASVAGAPAKLGMYRLEWWGFFGALYDPADGPHRPMWEHLRRLLNA